MHTNINRYCVLRDTSSDLIEHVYRRKKHYCHANEDTLLYKSDNGSAEDDKHSQCICLLHRSIEAH